MDCVCVLLSTYNGQKYIVEQMESILQQENVAVRILVRDDGSSDGTVEALKRIHDNRITIVEGGNLGYCGSFSWLIHNAPEADYYSFADQDDVWDSDKLTIGIKSVDMVEPALYACSARLVDSDGKEIGFFGSREDNYILNVSKLMNSGMQGCSMVLNRSLMALLKRYTPKYEWPHDYWATTVALFVGKVTYDSKPHFSYRQHKDNVTGGQESWVDLVRKRKNAMKRGLTNPWSRMAEDVLSGYDDCITINDHDMLSLASEYRECINKKIQLLGSKKIKKTGIIRNAALKALIIFNKF